MDTHVATHPDIEPGMSARLPGEADDIQPDGRLPSSTAAPTRRRRVKLLAGVALAALAIAGGVFLVSPYNTVYPVPKLEASFNSAANYAEGMLKPILAPAASLAKVSVPPTPPAIRDAYKPAPRDQEVAEVLSFHPASTEPADADHAAVSGAAGPPAKASDHPATASPPAVVAAAAEPGAPAGYVPREPGSPVVSKAQPLAPAASVMSPTRAAVDPATAANVPSKDATASVISSLPRARPISGGEPAPLQLAPDDKPAPLQPRPAPVQLAPDDKPALLQPAPSALRPAPPYKPAVLQPQPVPPILSPVAEPTPSGRTEAVPPAPPSGPDALASAANLRAGPMTAPEQVQVLDLVTEVARLVRDLRKQQAQMRSDMAKSSLDTTKRLTDFERRLALAEARSGVAAADDATGGTPVTSSVEPAADPVAALPKAIEVVATRPIAVVPPSAPSGGPKLYRVQAASPGLALLAQVDRGGGDGAQMQVVVGDTVPDYGRVKSIGQKGTAWVVTTEHGVIQ